MHQEILDWEKWLRISAGLLTPVIAVIAAYVAWQQWRTNRRQLRLALFDRRMSVYNSTKAIILVAIQKTRLELNDILTFDFETREHEFLFGSDITDYLKEVRDKAMELYKQDLPPLKPAEGRTALVKWFLLHNTEARKKFCEYMAFQKAD
jgi:hypothetical protein